MHLAIAAAAASALAVAFAGAFGLHRAGDDWLAVALAMEAVDTGRPYAEVFAPFAHHFSPLWYAFEIFNYQRVGWPSDALIRAFVIAWAAIALAAFAWLARTLRLSTGGIAFGMLLLALHPINAAAYYSFDCYSQVAADTLAWISTALLVAVAAGRARPIAIAGALLLFAAGLLFKEQALAAALGAIVVAAWFRQRRVALAAAGMAALSLVFALARWRAGLWFDAEGPFALCMACAPSNAAMLLGGILLPVPVSQVYTAFRQGDWTSAWMLLAVILVAIVVALLATGLVRARRRLPAVTTLVIALLLSATFPVLLLADIGELYAHALLFWLALLAALAWDAAPARLPRLAGAAIVVMMAVALRVNFASIRTTGQLAAALLSQVHRALETVPSDAGIVLRGFEETPSDVEYGLLRIAAPGRLLLYGVALDVTRPEVPRFDSDADARDWHRRTGRPLYAIATDGFTVRARPLVLE